MSPVVALCRCSILLSGILTACIWPSLADAAEHGFLIGEGATLPVEITEGSPLEVRLDLSKFSKERASYAGVRFKLSVDDEAICVPILSITAPAGVLEKRPIHRGKPRYYTYNLTEAVNHTLDQGGLELAVEFSSHENCHEVAPISLKRVQFYLSDEDAFTLSLQQMVTPFWQTGDVWGETVFPNQVRLPLLAAPLDLPQVFSGLRTKEYADGGFLHTDNELLVAYSASNLIFPDAVIFPKDEKSAKGRAFKSRSGGYLLSPEGTWFQTRQLSVDYSFDPESWGGPKPNYQPELLPKTLEKIAQNEPFKVLLYGDSISMGANATALVGEPPYQWSWGQLIVDALQARTMGDLEYINAALGGTTAEWGEANAENLLASHKPDLVILAFGMNGSISPAEFGRMIESMMASVRSTNPEAEFILVHAMQPNEDFKPLKLYESYGAVMKALQQPGVLFADVWSMHGALIERKRYVDMTANHVNHPNDFLIRIYAQVVLSRFVNFE